jgi:hypothetical protein
LQLCCCLLKVKALPPPLFPLALKKRKKTALPPPFVLEKALPPLFSLF